MLKKFYVKNNYPEKSYRTAKEDPKNPIIEIKAALKSNHFIIVDKHNLINHNRESDFLHDYDEIGDYFKYIYSKSEMNDFLTRNKYKSFIVLLTGTLTDEVERMVNEWELILNWSSKPIKAWFYTERMRQYDSRL